MEKKLLKKAFDAGRSYQDSINPFSGKSINSTLSFTKWYNNIINLNTPNVIKELTDFYMWMQENGYDHNIRIRVERKAEIYLNELWKKH